MRCAQNSQNFGQKVNYMNKITIDNVRPKYIVILIWSIFFFLFFGLQQITNWPFLGSQHVKSHPSFIDLGPGLKSLECYRSVGLNVYDFIDSEECWYIYGSTLLRVLSPTGLSVKSTITIGWILIAIMAFILGYIFSLSITNLKSNIIIYLGIVISPVTMLLLERGNVDILILLFLIISAIMFYFKLELFSVVLILITASFKFYTLPLAFIFCLLISGKKQKYFGLLLTLLTFVLILNDLRKIQDIPRVANSSFGNSVIAMYFETIGLNIPLITQNIIGIFFLLIAIKVLMMLHLKWENFKTPKFPIINTWNIPNYLEVFFLITFLSCYFAGVSFDFRMIYLTLACLLEIARTYKSSNTFPIIIGLDIVVNWVSNSKYLEPLGDLSLLFIIAYFILLFRKEINIFPKNKMQK